MGARSVDASASATDDPAARSGSCLGTSEEVVIPTTSTTEGVVDCPPKEAAQDDLAMSSSAAPNGVAKGEDEKEAVDGPTSRGKATDVQASQSPDACEADEAAKREGGGNTKQQMCTADQGVAGPDAVDTTPCKAAGGCNVDTTPCKPAAKTGAVAEDGQDACPSPLEP